VVRRVDVAEAVAVEGVEAVAAVVDVEVVAAVVAAVGVVDEDSRRNTETVGRVFKETRARWTAERTDTSA
jgi:hypothetical protein